MYGYQGKQKQQTAPTPNSSPSLTLSALFPWKIYPSPHSPQEPARSFSCESQELLSFTPAKFFGISAPPRETIRQKKRSQCPSPLSLATSFVSPKYWLLYFLSNKMEENSLRERNKRKNLKPQQVHNLGYDLIVTL